MKNPKYVLEVSHPNSGRIVEIQTFSAKERKKALRTFKKETEDIYNADLSEHVGKEYGYEMIAWKDDDEIECSDEKTEEEIKKVKL
jgi:hypothetical protein